MNQSFRTLCMGLLFVALSGCAERQVLPDTEDDWVVCLPSGQRWVPVGVEVAATPAQRRQGLSGRERLPAREGMLFLYPDVQSPDNSFWMFETLFPLEIAFLDSEGRIVSIRSMRPCIHDDPDACPDYPAGEPHQAALEVNDGLFEQLDVTEGDRLKLSGKAEKKSCEDLVPFGDKLFERAS